MACRLVEDKQLCPWFRNHSELKQVLLTAGKLSYLLIYDVRLQAILCEIRFYAFLWAEAVVLHNLIYGLVFINRLTLKLWQTRIADILIYVNWRIVILKDIADQSGLARSVGTYYGHLFTGIKFEAYIPEKLLIKIHLIICDFQKSARCFPCLHIGQHNLRLTHFNKRSFYLSRQQTVKLGLFGIYRLSYFRVHHIRSSLTKDFHHSFGTGDFLLLFHMLHPQL